MASEGKLTFKISYTLMVTLTFASEDRFFLKVSHAIREKNALSQFITLIQVFQNLLYSTVLFFVFTFCPKCVKP